MTKLTSDDDINDTEIAKAVSCTTRSVRNARSNLLQYGTIDAPSQTRGRPREITENTWPALRLKLIEHPGLS